MEALEVPLSSLKPVRLTKEAVADSCGLFFPHSTRLHMGLVVDWDGETHLIHLDGEYIFYEAGIDIGHSARGVVMTEFEFRVDVTSRYRSGETWDPPGALVVKNGELSLYCSRLGDRIHYDPRPVPLRKGYSVRTPEEGCGFKRWTIAIRDGEKSKIVRSFEALPIT